MDGSRQGTVALPGDEAAVIFTKLILITECRECNSYFHLVTGEAVNDVRQKWFPTRPDNVSFQTEGVLLR